MSQKKLLDFRNKTSNRSFGLFFSMLILCYSLLPIFKASAVNLLLVLVATYLGFVALWWPSFFQIPNTLWFKFGLALNRFMSPIFIGVVYFGFISPVGLMRRAIKKGALPLEFEKPLRSYWKVRNQDLSQSMRNQF